MALTAMNEQLKEVFEQQQKMFTEWAEVLISRSKNKPDNFAEYTLKDQATVAAKMTQYASEFSQFGNQVLDQLKTNPAKDQLDQIFSQFREHIQQQTGEALLAQWQLPEKVASLFRTHSFHDDVLFENPYLSGFKSLLNYPSVGSTHELQESIQNGVKHLLEYQEALTEYIDQYGQINEKATSALLDELTNGDNPVETLGELHDLWVECYEKSYSEVLFTEAHQRSHGRTSNAVLRLRAYAQDMRDIQFEAAGLATRKGLDTALKRQHMLRKEMRQVQRVIRPDEQTPETSVSQLIQDMRNEIADLRNEVDTLKAQQTAPAKKAPARKASPTKTSAAKRSASSTKSARPSRTTRSSGKQGGNES